MAAVRASARERLLKQEAEEAKAKDSLVKNAAGYLEKFYQVPILPKVIVIIIICMVFLPVTRCVCRLAAGKAATYPTP